MATTLSKPVSREVEMTGEFGKTGPVIVTIDEEGIVLRGKGTRRELAVPWWELARAAIPPERMPARHVASPLDWLVE